MRNFVVIIAICWISFPYFLHAQPSKQKTKKEKTSPANQALKPSSASVQSSSQISTQNSVQLSSPNNAQNFSQTTSATTPSASSNTAPIGASEAPTTSIRSNLPDTAAVVKVRIQTTIGNIDVDLYRRAAPGTVENFLHYVSGGYYTGGFFHRTVKKDNQLDKPDSLKIEVIQATVGSMYDRYAMPPIALETTQETGLKHLDGTISMARDEPNSAQYEFFICIGDQPVLDFGGKRNPDGQGFAAFGRVTKGMEIVRKIHQSRAASQALAPPIMIIGITRRS